MNKSLLSKPTSSAWKRIGIDHAAGVAIPIFALRSKQSVGIGDVEDLKLLVDWCKNTGQKIIQILPINDIGDYETSPYNALSAMALDPIYISLEKLIKSLKIHDSKISKAISTARTKLEKGSSVDYEKVRASKQQILRLIFDLIIAKTTPPALQKFIADNTYWLNDYALFRIIKKQYVGKSWTDWPKKIRERHSATILKIEADFQGEILYIQFLQWVLFNQFSETHKYANKQGVFLKGDIPILISPDSVEAWAHPEYFKPGFVAGAPPDMFSEKGQCWGFPVYDWDQLEKTGYKFWVDRLNYAENFFDIYRIDHVLGFFRIWTIPRAKSALHGFFDPQKAISKAQFSHNHFSVEELIDHNILAPVLGNPDKLAFAWFYWKEPYFYNLPPDRQELLRRWEKESLHIQDEFWAENGRKLLLTMITASKMLPCAEDLGVVPPCVPRVLEELGIPGLRVLRWTRSWDKSGHPFVGPEEQDFISVVTTSVHDCEPLEQWWLESSQADRNAFWAQFLRWENEASAVLSKESHGHLLKKVYQSSAVLVINPLQDILSQLNYFAGDPAQYRINIPGTISGSNWSVRYPFLLETLFEDSKAMNLVQSCIGEHRASQFMKNK